MEQSSESVLKKLGHGRFREAVYRDLGNGFPVMLVHGFPVDGSLWDRQAQSLKKDFRLLIPDLPGSGESPQAGPLSMEDMAEFLHDILVREQIRQCVLIGHSMGGYIVLAFAEHFPDKLLGFGLFHSTAFADSQEKKAGRQRSVAFMKQYGAGLFLRQMIPTLFSQQYRKDHAEAITALIRSKEKADAGTLTAYYQAMMERPDRTHVLKETKVPVLFVIGKEDTAAPEKDVLKQASMPAVADIQLLENVAHLGMIEKPELSGDLLKNFIHLCRELSHST